MICNLLNGIKDTEQECLVMLYLFPGTTVTSDRVGLPSMGCSGVSYFGATSSRLFETDITNLVQVSAIVKCFETSQKHGCRYSVILLFQLLQDLLWSEWRFYSGDNIENLNSFFGRKYVGQVGRGLLP